MGAGFKYLTGAKKAVSTQPRHKAIVEPKTGEGSIQKGVRAGNVFQMVNPFAPAEYGSGSEFVYSYENDSLEHGTPGKALPKGIILSGLRFSKDRPGKLSRGRENPVNAHKIDIDDFVFSVFIENR